MQTRPAADRFKLSISKCPQESPNFSLHTNSGPIKFVFSNVSAKKSYTTKKTTSTLGSHTSASAEIWGEFEARVTSTAVSAIPVMAFVITRIVCALVYI